MHALQQFTALLPFTDSHWHSERSLSSAVNMQMKSAEGSQTMPSRTCKAADLLGASLQARAVPFLVWVEVNGHQSVSGNSLQ